MITALPRRRVVQLLTGLVLVALAVTAAVWWVGYQRSVQVTASTGVPQCQGTTPRTLDGESDPGDADSGIPLRKGFTCRVRIRVVNWGDHDVVLDRVTVPIGGTEARGGFHVLDIDGQPVADGDIDATADLDLPLEPGTTVIEIGLAFQPSGCVDVGGGEQPYPTIEVASLLASHGVMVGDFPVLLGTKDSTCPSA